MTGTSQSDVRWSMLAIYVFTLPADVQMSADFAGCVRFRVSCNVTLFLPPPSLPSRRSSLLVILCSTLYIKPKQMIRSLPPSSITSLTSGQVLTSLTSAVKELLENSIDAHAHTIQISVTPSLLCVKDDGTGIPKEEHSVLCRKHWTSKISTFEDLESTRTMGFRGTATHKF